MITVKQTSDLTTFKIVNGNISNPKTSEEMRKRIETALNALDEKEKLEREVRDLRHTVREWTYYKNQRALINALKLIEENFPELETDEEMSGSDTVATLCAIWPQIKEALENIRY